MLGVLDQTKQVMGSVRDAETFLIFITLPTSTVNYN